MENQSEKTLKATPEAAEELFDLSTLDTVKAANKGAELQLKHPDTKKPLPIFVGILGRDSDVFREIVRDRQNKAIAEMALAQEMGSEPQARSAEEVYERGTELILACMTHWRTETVQPDKSVKSHDVIAFGPDKMTFSVPNAKKLLETLPWFRTQVDAGIGTLELFLKP